MRINHNISALNTYRQLTMNTTAGSKSLEKLSSGYRINRAGDDAAGLSISEKMRGQIRGLEQASRNAQDGISLIQTAEGALNETHAILQRMRELAVQASTDTNTLDDRKEIQKEINQLLEEIDRIADNTEFNTKKLINGDLAAKKAEAPASGDPSTPASTYEAAKVTGEAVDYTTPLNFSSTNLVFELNGTEITLNGSYANAEAVATAIQGALTTGGNETVTVTAEGNSIVITAAEGEAIEISDATSGNLSAIGLEAGTTPAAAVGGTIGSLRVADVDNAEEGGVLTQAGADAAITNINTAITQVSAERSRLGAIQNRLEHTIKNLDNAAENLTASESRIRDVDMAKEMMEFTKNNILQQAAQAMLAQANMQPQGILQLLR
jgi:flagellin